MVLYRILLQLDLHFSSIVSRFGESAPELDGLGREGRDHLVQGRRGSGAEHHLVLQRWVPKFVPSNVTFAEYWVNHKVFFTTYYLNSALISELQHVALLWFSHLLVRPMSVELHQTGAFEERSTDWATATWPSTSEVRICGFSGRTSSNAFLKSWVRIPIRESGFLTVLSFSLEIANKIRCLLVAFESRVLKPYSWMVNAITSIVNVSMLSVDLITAG